MVLAFCKAECISQIGGHKHMHTEDTNMASHTDCHG